MLSIKQGREDAYTFPVKIKVPSTRLPGQFQEYTFQAKIKALPTSESRAMVAAADQAREQGRHGEAMDLDKQLLRQVICGWEGVTEEFNEDNLEEALDNPFFLSGLMDAYRKSLSGEAVQRRAAKN